MTLAPTQRVIVHQPGAHLATSVIGTRGLKNLGGRIQEEYLAKLKSWRTASDIYIEMMDDVMIGALLDAIKLPLLAADFDVTPASDSLPDLFAREFLWQNLERMDRQTWRSHVDDMLHAVGFGFAIGEIVLEKRADGRLWLRNIEPRGQETLERWEFEDEDNPDAVTGFTQRDPDSGEGITIPIDKTVHVTFRGRKGNPMGQPLLRSLYRPWKFIKELENMEGIGIERNVGGMPVAELPEQPVQPEDITSLKESLRNLRVDEEMYLITPHGLTVHEYGGGAPTGHIGPVIERKQKEMLTRAFAQFLKLGMDNVGTQALVKGSQDFFALGLRAVQQEILEVWNQQLVPFLFHFNPGQFPGMTDLPTITWNDPGKVDIEAFVSAYSQGVTAKLISPIREDEEFFRAVADLPDLPDGEGEEPRNVEQPAPGGVAFSIPFDWSAWPDANYHLPGQHDQSTHAGGRFGGSALILSSTGSVDSIDDAFDVQDRIIQEIGEEEAIKLFDAADRWSEGETDDTGNLSNEKFRLESEAWVNGDDTDSDGAILAEAIASSPPNEEVLYRGVSVNSDFDSLSAEYELGSEFDILPASFTADEDVAREFTNEGMPVIFELESGANVLNIQPLMNKPGFLSMHERVTMGRFRVSGVVPEGENGARVLIQQIGVFGG